MAWHDIRYSRVNFIEQVRIAGELYRREILTGEDGGYRCKNTTDDKLYFLSNNSTVPCSSEEFEEWTFRSFEDMVKFAHSEGALCIELWGIEPDDYEACLDMEMEVYSNIEYSCGFSTEPLPYLILKND